VSADAETFTLSGFQRGRSIGNGAFCFRTGTPEASAIDGRWPLLRPFLGERKRRSALVAVLTGEIVGEDAAAVFVIVAIDAEVFPVAAVGGYPQLYF
jgi:hypothetical protein